MVSAITQHDATFCEWELPMAKGLAYQAIWLDLEAIRHGRQPETVALSDSSEINFRKYK